MKKFAFVLLLVCGFSISILAQTSGTRPRRVETTPSPTPNGSSTAPNSSTKSKLPPFLGGAIGNNSPTVSKEPAQTESAPTKSPQKPPVLINSSPSKSPQIQTSSDKNTKPQTSTGQTSDEVIDDDEVIKVETELVTIPVTVYDRQGRFIPGLRQSDFKVFEDGKEQEIAYFATTEQPFTVVLLLDVSNSTKFKIDEIQNAAIAFVRQLKENDRVMVISFDEQIHVLTEPTNDRYRIASAIRSANFGGGTSLYDAVNFAVNRKLSRIEGRKAIVLFTDGVDTTSKYSSYDSTVRDVEELDTTIYTVHYNTFNDMQSSGGGSPTPYPYPRSRRRSGGLGDIIGIILGGGIVINGGGNTGGGGGSVGTSRAEYERGEQYVEELATRTGGRKYEADSTRNLETAFYNIAEELRRQYSIGYYPTETGQTGQRKQIKVRVNRPDSVVRSRDSYIVGQQNTVRNTK